MKEWIFKIIYYPIFGIILLCAAGILAFLLKEVDWMQPFRWLVLIGSIAYAADKIINKQEPNK